MTTISYSKYKDKVLAGWIGKSIGGVIGARLEGHKHLKQLSIDELWPGGLMPNDDLDLQVLWLEAMQERGVYLTSDDMTELWQDRCWYSFCEYGVFLNNVQRGIMPPLSGTWNNEYFRESEGCPIRAEIWGYVAPGNPQLAAEFAALDGTLDHCGAAVEAEQFLAAAASQSLLTSDLDEAIEVGLSVISPQSIIARAVPRVRTIAAQYSDPAQAWRVTIREFGDRDASKAISNHALVLLALFLGKGDFKKTMQLCANFGWDTDCTASTAGALLAALGGTASLPADWLELLGKNLICGINVKHQGATLEQFAENTCRIGVEMAALRNPNIAISGAPEVEIRPRRAPQIGITVRYDAEPVLWKNDTTCVTLLIENPLPHAQNGRLEISAPAGIVCEIEAAPESLAAQSTLEVPLRIRREGSGGWIADKNLFDARWLSAERVLASRRFGLCGARQWQIYGPYFDMWDKTKSKICPYWNDEFVGGPYARELTGDVYNQYAHLEYSYLDEARLLREDLPEEAPLLLEHGEDTLCAQDFGGFKGQACYYLVRTIRSTVEDFPCPLVLGRSGPYRAWLDGVEIRSGADMRCWAQLDNANLNVCLTGKPQRLVLKLIRLTDAFDFSLYPMGGGDTTGQGRGISNIVDILEDQAV